MSKGRERIFNDVAGIITELLGYSRDEITEESVPVDDFGADDVYAIKFFMKAQCIVRGNIDRDYFVPKSGKPTTKMWKSMPLGEFVDYLLTLNSEGS